MAGTIPLSLTQQFDSLGNPLSGGRLHSFAAGTTTPQSGYQDSGLTIPHPNPIILDAAGRVPQAFWADGSIKIRLDSSTGVTQLAADGILVIGASSGGGGGSPVDPATVLQTGDVKTRYGTGVHTGWVRANARTIGSATSGATERANADTEALFLYLWNADPNLAVSGGRGANAAADFAANKTIALPDARGRALAALTDMGNSANGIFTGSTFTNGDAITLGSRLGVGTNRTLTQQNLPNIAPAFTGFQGGIIVNSINNGVPINALSSFSFGAGGLAALVGNIANPLQSTGLFTPAGTVQSINGGVTQTSFDTVSPFLLVTTYLKL